MEEIIRVTKVGGCFVLNVPNIAYIRRRLKLLFGKRPRTSGKPGWDGGHIQYFAVGDFYEFFEKRHVAIVKVTGGRGRFMQLRNLWPSLLSADLVVKGVKKD